MKKHFFFWILTFTFFCFCLTASAAASDYAYQPLSSTTCQITGYSGNSQALTLPTEIDGYRVVAIGESAFNSNTAITSVSIPGSVTVIESHAFYCCYGLSSITLTDGLTTIGPYAFFECNNVKSLTLPDSITSIGTNGLPAQTTVKFGTNHVIEQFCRDNFIKYVSDNSSISDDGITTVDEKINWVIATYITPGMSEYQKALTLYKWLCTNVTYDYDYLQTGKAASKYGVSGKAALLDGTAICQGFAEGYLWLLEAVGIEAMLVTGPTTQGSHAWNLAKINGKWYYFDPTWDEMYNGDSFDYFALSDRAIRYEHTLSAGFDKYVCNSYEANHNYITGKYDRAIANLQKAILTLISEGTYSGTVDSDYFDLRGVGGYTIAFIVENETDWPLGGRAEITPAEWTEYTFTFYPGKDPSARIPGDVNENGSSDIFDALLILQHDVGWDVAINVSNGDVNADGVCSIFDALLILQYDVGWNVTLQ